MATNNQSSDPAPALLDANVLYPCRKRDILLRFSEARIFFARWTEQILSEWTRNILALWSFEWEPAGPPPTRNSIEPQLSRSRSLEAEPWDEKTMLD